MKHVLSWERIAKEEGKEEGIKEAKHNIAAKLLKNGLGIDIVIECTGLPRTEIEKMAAEVF